MKTATYTSLLALLLIPLAGCSTEDDEFSKALPDVDDVQMLVPELSESNAAAKTTVDEAPPEGEGNEDHARCADESHQVAQRVNEEVRQVLERLGSITQNEPTVSNGNVSIYMPPEDGEGRPDEAGGPPDGAGGPPEDGEGRPDEAGGPPEGAGGPPEDGEGRPDEAGGPPEGAGGPPGLHRLVVETQADGSFNYAFEIVPEGGSEWLSHITGVVDAGSTKEAGSGAFSVDYNVMGDMDPEHQRGGTASYAYLFTEAGARTIDVELVDMTMPEGDVMDGNIFYDQGADRFGTLDVAQRSINTEGTMGHMMNKTQWDDTHAGRCDGNFSGRELEDSVAQRSQCWDGDIMEVFFSESIDGAEAQTRGDEAQCVFDAAERTPYQNGTHPHGDDFSPGDLEIRPSILF